jgi:hypothetical protein
MAEKKDIKKALDEMLGDELPEAELQAIELYRRVASWEQTNRPGEGFITKISTIIFLPKKCERHHLIDVSGGGSTGSDGKRQFLLTDFICPVVGSFEQPINIVATPLARIPVFLTILHSLVMDPSNTFGQDVQIQIFTWDANGVAAPNIRFNWRCRVPFVEPGPL